MDYSLLTADYYVIALSPRAVNHFRRESSVSLAKIELGDAIMFDESIPRTSVGTAAVFPEQHKSLGDLGG